MEKMNRQLDLNLGLGETFRIGNGNLLFRAMGTKGRPRKRAQRALCIEKDTNIFTSEQAVYGNNL